MVETHTGPGLDELVIALKAGTDDLGSIATPEVVNWGDPTYGPSLATDTEFEGADALDAIVESGV